MNACHTWVRMEVMPRLLGPHRVDLRPQFIANLKQGLTGLLGQFLNGSHHFFSFLRKNQWARCRIRKGRFGAHAFRR